jgi:site-specific recombinase XerD
LVAERNLAHNTQRSYRDALTLLIPFIAGKLHHSVDRLTVINVSAELVRLFLADLEQSRKCSIATRNQRLAAIHALARFVGEHSPEHIEWCGQIRSIPFKKANKAVVPYLDKPEMDALLRAPDRQTAQGRRDHALLLFLYNSGARAHEDAQLIVTELDLTGCSVKIHGKGGKERHCPLWPSRIEELKPLVLNRPPAGRVFLNRCGHPMTRFGIYALIERYVRRIQAQIPSLAKKRVSPHSIRQDNSDTPAPRQRRHQYRPRLARARLAGYHQHLRRGRSRDEGQGACEVRSHKCGQLKPALARGSGTDDILEGPLAGLVMWRPEQSVR